MKRTPLQRRVALRKLGPKGIEWAAARAKLKVAFERAGITRCEAQYIGCMGGMYLGFAHSLRRRFITTPEQFNEVILCCQHCHSILDLCDADDVLTNVQEIIAARPEPVKNVTGKYF